MLYVLGWKSDRLRAKLLEAKSRATAISSVSKGSGNCLEEQGHVSGWAGGRVPGLWEEAGQMVMLQGSVAEMPTAKAWDSFI